LICYIYKSLSSKTSVSLFASCLQVLNIEGIDGIACNLCVNKLNRINLNDKLHVIREQQDTLIQCLRDAPGVEKYVGFAQQQAKVPTTKGEMVVVYFTPKGMKRPSLRETPTPTNQKALKKNIHIPKEDSVKTRNFGQGDTNES
jgi:hypothetical protein